jgi:hypothetical protein
LKHEGFNKCSTIQEVLTGSPGRVSGKVARGAKRVSSLGGGKMEKDQDYRSGIIPQMILGYLTSWEMMFIYR